MLWYSLARYEQIVCYGLTRYENSFVWFGQVYKLFGTVWPGMKIGWNGLARYENCLYGDDSALLFQFQFEVMRLVGWSGWLGRSGAGNDLQESWKNEMKFRSDLPKGTF